MIAQAEKDRLLNEDMERTRLRNHEELELETDVSLHQLMYCTIDLHLSCFIASACSAGVGGGGTAQERFSIEEGRHLLSHQNHNASARPEENQQ